MLSGRPARLRRRRLPPAEELLANITAQLDENARAAGIEPRYETAGTRFAHLLRELHERTGQRVVVLVDEYDKPILDALDTPDVAAANRDFLRALYGTVKSSDADVQFAFFTGVSKFSKVSLFSDLNQLIDITLTPRYSAICGYTDEDIDTVFAAELPGLDRARSVTGTTATAGAGRSAFTTRSTSFCCSFTGSSAATGSRRRHRRFWCAPSPGADSARWTWRGCAAR